MAIPQRFNSQPDALVNYSYTDIASGTGYVVYYLCKTILDDTATYILTPNIVEGAYTSTSGIHPNQDYDLTPFNKPQIVKGIAYLSGQVYDTGTDGHIGASLKHVRGATVTTIGVNTNSPDVNGNITFNLSFDVSEILFKKGDILRATVGSTQGANISIDPSETLPAGINVTKLTIPFKIDV